MTAVPEPNVIEDLEELFEAISLESIQFEELSVRRYAGEEGPLDLSFTVARSDDQTGMLARLNAHGFGRGAEYTVAVQATYQFAEPTEIKSEILAEFLNRSAMVSLMPFLREAMLSSAARLQVDVPLLPLMGLNQPHNPEFRSDLAEASDDTSEGDSPEE